MDMEGALRARLIAAGPVTALVGQRVYWDERPQGAVAPDVTLQMIVDSRDQHMKGFQGLQRALVQADVRGTTFAQKKSLKEAVIAAFAPANSSNGISFERAVAIQARTANERTDTQFFFRDIIDFTFHHAPA